MNPEQNNSNYDLKKISKKYNSTNNLILSNINEKNKNKYKLNIINNNEPLFKYSNFNNNQIIKVNINNKTTSESENISEIANNLLLLSKINKNSLKNTYINNKDFYTYNGNKEMNDLKANYDIFSVGNNTISVNKNKELYKNNNNNRLIMKQSKENDILFSPTVLKVDEGTSIRISITTSNNNENTLMYKSKETSPLRIMTNEIITFTNDKKSLKQKKENKLKLLYNNFKISNEISICYNLAKKDIKNEKIIKSESINKTNNIIILKNDKKELSKSKVVNIKISNSNTNSKTNINTNNNKINTNNNNKKIDNNKKQIDKKIKINQNRNNKNIKKNNLILNTKKTPNTISYKKNKQITQTTEKSATNNLHQNSIQHKKDDPKKFIASTSLTNSNILQKNKSKIKSNKIPNKDKNTINTTNNSYLKNKNSKKAKQNKSKKKNDKSNIYKKAQNNRSRKQSITSQDERDDILINQIITETESKQRQKKNLHIQIKLDNNTYIKYNQNDLIKNSIYTNNKNENISHRQFDDLIYNEILKSKFNLIPIIKKNFNAKNFKINKEYKLNENLEEKEIIPELYQEYSNDEDFKLLEKTLERSIEKTFKRKYEKSKDKNNLSLSLSDNKKKNKDKEKNKNEEQNTFNKIRDMFDEDDQESESESENSEKSDDNDNQTENEDDDIENKCNSENNSNNDNNNDNDDDDEGNNEDGDDSDDDDNDRDNSNENDEENEIEEE